MVALDLRIQPPREPRAQLDGLLFMPRTIDKIRATLPGGDLGPYHVAQGMSALLLRAIAVPLADIRRAVAEAAHDAGVAAWLRANADTAQYAYVNELLAACRHENLPPEERKTFDAAYPEYLLGRYPVVLDLLEADDREIYPALRKE